MKLALEAPALRTLAITGRDERFPVNRVFCVGRNYAAPAKPTGLRPGCGHVDHALRAPAGPVDNSTSCPPRRPSTTCPQPSTTTTFISR